MTAYTDTRAADLVHPVAGSSSQPSTAPATTVPDLLGEIALRIAQDKGYRHRAAEALLAIAADLRDRELPQDAALRAIGDLAHDKSTGPAVPDTLWEIRGIAYEALGAPLVVEAEPATTKRITPDAPASPAPPQGEREAFEAWAKLENHDLRRWPAPDGTYADSLTGFMWDAWKARASLSASTPSAEARLREVEGYLACRLDEQDFQACVRAVATLRGLIDATRNPDEFVRSMLDAAMAPPADNKENGNG